ncbi:MAG: thermonuclease family protein [Myxococcota bacterium]
MWWTFAVAQAAAPAFPEGPVQVVKVYDGDTLTLESGQRVRVVGINTPELRPLEPFAKEAKTLAEGRVLHQSVTLTPAGSPPMDHYGRLLALVSSEDGDLSEALVRAGFAHVFVLPPKPPNFDALLEAEATARTKGLGIWSLPRFQQTFTITSFHANARGDDRQNVNGEYLRLCNVSGIPNNLEGWTVENRRGANWTLPALEVPAGHTVAIRMGQGETQTSPNAPLTVYLGSRRPRFDNTYDVVVLRDPTGREVARRQQGKPEN